MHFWALDTRSETPQPSVNPSSLDAFFHADNPHSTHWHTHSHTHTKEDPKIHVLEVENKKVLTTSVRLGTW